MRGWFLASAPGRCTDRGGRTNANSRVFYPEEDRMDTRRLCVECGSAPTPQLDLFGALA